MGSSRLPGKVLMEIGGVPLILYLYSRLKSLREKYPLIVATTENPKDDILSEFCQNNKIDFWRGPEFDVLTRFFQLSTIKNFDVIVRLNADCPFLDANFVSDKIDIFLENLPNIDYAATILTETYPLGMHVEIMTKDALTRAHNQCDDIYLREHVTPFIYQNSHKFTLLEFQSNENNADIRLTIDYPEDIAFVNAVVRELRNKHKNESISNIIDLLRRSEDLSSYNQHIKKDQKIHKLNPR